ncbi:MAG: Bug family tripartite tricarboxylate transporter substrate binding protein [Burkholderiales bacterium]
MASSQWHALPLNRSCASIAWNLAAAMALAYSAQAISQDYPRGTINLVIPIAPGDGADVTGRNFAEELGKLLKVSVVVVNRPGAGMALGTDNVAKSKKDGYTLGLTTNGALTIRRVLDPATASYDPDKDITHLGLTMRTPSILAVSNEAPYRTLGEMVEFSKKNPGKVRIGTAGAGSVGDFCMAIVSAMTGAEFTAVPYAGATPAITALRGGHIEGVFLSLGVVSAHLRSGAMKGIVISSKFPAFADIPTMADLGYKQNLLGVSLLFFVPAGVPAEVNAVLQPAIEKLVKDPVLAAKHLTMGWVHEYAGPERVAAEMRDELRMVEQIARARGMITAR